MRAEYKIRRSIRNWLLFFIAALILSGMTTFALETELAWLNHLLRNSHGPVSFWILF
ncbi:MAG TPA: hypothetical protein VK622_15615 [Puia sp.]|nr:hypothetical protein [Puia sp.]